VPISPPKSSEVHLLLRVAAAAFAVFSAITLTPVTNWLT
jgi:hypothetical protein